MKRLVIHVTSSGARQDTPPPLPPPPPLVPPCYFLLFFSLNTCHFNWWRHIITNDLTINAGANSPSLPRFSVLFRWVLFWFFLFPSQFSFHFSVTGTGPFSPSFGSINQPRPRFYFHFHFHFFIFIFIFIFFFFFWWCGHLRQQLKLESPSKIKKLPVEISQRVNK